MRHASAPTRTNSTMSDRAGSLERLHIMRELADTTWRMAVPVLMGAGAGIFLDITFNSKPWLTILGSVIGFFGAGYLVHLQLMRAAKLDKSEQAAQDQKKDTNK